MARKAARDPSASAKAAPPAGVVLNARPLEQIGAMDDPGEEASFIPPEGYEAVLNFTASIAVFGDPGSGKTALARALTRWAESDPDSQTGPTARPFVIPYPPAYWPQGPSSAPEVRDHPTAVLSAFARRLYRWLLKSPTAFGRLRDSHRLVLRWLFSHYLEVSFSFIAQELADTLEDEGASSLAEAARAWVSLAGADPYPPHGTLESKLNGVLRCLRALEFPVAWLVVDVHHVDWVDNANWLRAQLEELLRTSSLYGQEGLAVKLCLPAGLAPIAQGTWAMTQERLQTLRLDWKPEAIGRIIAQRLSQTGLEGGLPALCAPGFLDKLNEVRAHFTADQDIRGWLRLVKELVSIQVETRCLPLGLEHWPQAARRLYRSLAPLRVEIGRGIEDQTQKETEQYDLTRAWRGREALTLSSREREILACLWKAHQHGRPLSPADLHAWLPGTFGGGYQDDKARQNVHTAISRLREKLEPVEGEPIYLRTDGHNGYWLDNTITTEQV